jgi:ABC-type dipeptide/oligopeptide/nickel transport system permease component
MLTYIGRRLLQMIPVFIGVTILLFILRTPGVLPGDPVKLITGERAISPALYNQVVKENALDRSIPYQYVRWMKHLFQGDLGQSFQLKRSVSSVLWDKFPNTFKLAIIAILIEAILGILAGILSAVKRFSFWDMLVTLSTSILVALPVFWLGMLLQVLFGIKFKQWGLPYLPIQGMHAGDFPAWVYYILPAVTLAAISTACLTGSQVIWRHGLKNALIPVVTYIGLDLAAMIGGTILTETVFNWPGVGYQIYKAILQRDWPIVMGAVVIIVILVMFINLLVDISYAFLDPRIRYDRKKK